MAEPENTPLEYRRDEDFTALYANNVILQASVWDLKLLFGELDQSDPSKSLIEQHTSMALSWPTAKIAAYFITVNVLAHQASLGQIQLRPDVVPARPNPDAPDVDPNNRALVLYMAWVHDQFFGSSPYLPPDVAEQMKKQAESNDQKP